MARPSIIPREAGEPIENAILKARHAAQIRHSRYADTVDATGSGAPTAIPAVRCSAQSQLIKLLFVLLIGAEAR